MLEEDTERARFTTPLKPSRAVTVMLELLVPPGLNPILEGLTAIV
jgi:hypothetical protein